MNEENEQTFLRMLGERKADNDLTKREKKQLKQPVTRVQPDNIFTWHLNQHTVFEDETDPKLLKRGVKLRRVGVTDGGRLAEDQIAAQEKRLGIRLPAPWRDVYKYYNGGFSHDLLWGDLNDPRYTDIIPIAQGRYEYLALEDVAPVRDLLPTEMNGLDCRRLDPKLIAIGCSDCQAVLLDYRQSEDPRVCRAFFSRYDGDPLDGWEEDEYTHWWPNMGVFFRGLYLQDRII